MGVNGSVPSEPSVPAIHRQNLVKAVPGLTPQRRCVTIEVLPDDTLVEILFVFCRVSSLFHCLELAHVCRKWRRVVFASLQRLDLRLYCTPGTRVFKTLASWPALPIVVKYGGSHTLDPPTSEDEDNVLVALNYSDRVHSISLTVTSSLVDKLGTIKARFTKLEELILFSEQSLGKELPRTLYWGTRLRRIQLTGVAFPSLSRLLSSSKDLVEIQLHEIPNFENMSPEGFVNVFSGMNQLRSLSVRVSSPTSYPSPIGGISSSFASGEHVVLPALIRLKFRGPSGFLDRFVSRIKSPLLEDIDIVFDQLIYAIFIPQLVSFIDRIEAQKSHCRADIVSSEQAISVSFTQPGTPTRLKLGVPCRPLHWQLSTMALIFKSLSAFIFGVEDLRISATQPPSGQVDSDTEHWRNLIHPFRSVKWVHVTGDHSANIVCALQLPHRRWGPVLPSLHKLCVQEPEPRYAPLREAVASLLTSRLLSGRLIGVAYERGWDIMPRPTGARCYRCQYPTLNQFGAESLSQHVTIGVLPDDVLLSVFRHYLDTSPRHWPTLAHVCKGWRHIVFTFPKSLRLRLLCTQGTPVSKSLDIWPAVPIVVQYGGSHTSDLPTLEDEDNIMAALKHSDRVVSIRLTITRPLLKTFSGQFSELEELVLLPLNNAVLALPTAFQWGSRLRTLHLTGVAIPSLPQLLSRSHGLVDIQLHDIPNVGHLSPEAFANALSGMNQLRSLSVQSISLSHRDYLALPPPSGKRTTLPALTTFKYRGISTYLDCLVARIDAPHLEDADLTFFSQSTFDASQLGPFIDRTGIVKLHGRASIRSSENTISICFTDPGASTLLGLEIPCEQLDGQLSSMTQICRQFSPFLFHIEDLDINTSRRTVEEDNLDVDSEDLVERWPALIRLFRGVERLCLDGKTATNILRRLREADGETCLLPALQILRIQGPGSVALRDAIGSFVAWRQLSRRPIKVEGTDRLVTLLTCQDCKVHFATQQDFSQHFQDEHDLQQCVSCSFMWSPQLPYMYGTHLRQHHPGLHPADVSVFRPRQYASRWDSHGIQPDYPRASSGRLEQILRGFTDDPYPSPSPSL